MATKPRFRPSLAETRRQNQTALDYYRALSPREDAPRIDLGAKAKRAAPKPSAIPTEHQEQAALISWWGPWARARKIDHRLLFAIPNGAFFGHDALGASIQMAKLKREGLRDGVPDLLLAVPVAPAHGMFLEMKRREKATVSQEQKDMIAVFQSQGYRALVCRGWDDARIAIEVYLGAAAR